MKRNCHRCGKDYDEPQKDYLCLDCLKECGWEPVYATNADRIRSMSDEEMAEFLNISGICDTILSLQKGFCKARKDSCDGCVLDWLRAPSCAKEGE